jgi:hypothetical protein
MAGRYPATSSQEGATHTDRDIADPVLYAAMRSTTTINDALFTLLLLAVFSTAYDLLRLYIGRRARQTHTYSIINGVPEEVSGPGFLSSLARTSRGPRAAVYAKALFHSLLFVGVQWITTQVVIHIARAIASTVTVDSNVRRECGYLLAQGLECAAAIRYHVALNVVAILGLLWLIRSFDLHLVVPTSNRHCSQYSPGFRAMQNKCRCVVQSILAAPITIMYLHSRVSRQELWKHASLLITQVAVSLAIFLVGNLAIVFAALPVCH